jgi:hypothetical protein
MSTLIREIGSHAFGLIGLDVWIFDHGCMVHVPGGFLVISVFAKRNPSKTLKHLFESNHPIHVSPLPQILGTGLAGYF